MKVVILAGGLGTRLSEATHLIPKPMVEIGGNPILWHIMKIYSAYGFNEFILCLGYKQNLIKDWFANYYLHTSDATIDLVNNEMIYHNVKSEPWKITLVDTGLDTMTGGRVKKIQKYVGDAPFMLTYGDGVADINIQDLVNYHQKNKKLLTVTAYKPSGKFGSLQLNENNEVSAFTEKPLGDGSFISAGFFVCEPRVFDYLSEDDQLIFEKAPLENIAKDGQMQAYKHHGFWKPMDTLRDNHELNDMWNKNQAAWKIW